MSGSPLGQNAKKSKENGLTERQQELVTTEVCRRPSLNTQDAEPLSRWATAAEDQNGCIHKYLGTS